MYQLFWCSPRYQVDPQTPTRPWEYTGGSIGSTLHSTSGAMAPEVPRVITACEKRWLDHPRIQDPGDEMAPKMWPENPTAASCSQRGCYFLPNFWEPHETIEKFLGVGCCSKVHHTAPVGRSPAKARAPNPPRFDVRGSKKPATKGPKTDPSHFWCLTIPTSRYINVSSWAIPDDTGITWSSQVAPVDAMPGSVFGQPPSIYIIIYIYIYLSITGVLVFTGLNHVKSWFNPHWHACEL